MVLLNDMVRKLTISIHQVPLSRENTAQQMCCIWLLIFHTRVILIFRCMKGSMFTCLGCSKYSLTVRLNTLEFTLHFGVFLMEFSY